MKTRLTLVLPWFAGVALPILAQGPAPRVLGWATAAAEALPVPEITLLHALSNDGRWLLLSSASDRLTTNDHNAAADVFLFDRTTGQATLVSAGTNGCSGNGTSLAGGASADASRVAFLSRASNLVNADYNATWDVFVRDPASGTNLLASLAGNGGTSAGPASEALISEDGRYVTFRSAARDLAPDPLLWTFNLYRRDLVEARTECLTTNLPVGMQAAWRLAGWAVTPDAQALVVAVNPLPANSSPPVVAWRDLATGQSVNCAAALPPELAASEAIVHSAPAICANGRIVAFRSEAAIAAVSRHALCLHDVEQGTTTLLSLRTNDSGQQDFPASAFNAVLSADGRYVVYPAPWPTYDTSASVLTNGPSQVYCCDAQTQTTRLVSVAPDGVTPANADADDPRITPDGSRVLFVSRATNLLATAATESSRLYSWERETGALRVAAELGADDPAGRFVLSPNGAWIAALVADAAGHPAIYYPETADTVASYVSLAPVIEQSGTARGWIGVQAAGVSADGRYVALTAFPPGPVGDARHMQIYLHDTQTGARELLSRGVDGNLANSHAVPPSISADGSRLLFTSAATNLVSADRNAVADVFVQTIASGERSLLRTAPLTAGAPAQGSCLISPDGNTAFLTFGEGTQPVSRLAEVAGGKFAAPFSGVAVGSPSFNRNGQKIAVSFGGSTPSGANPRIEIHDVAARLAGGMNPPPALWTSPLQAVEPRLSADGSRVAYFHISLAGTNAMVVVDWVQNQLRFAKKFSQQVPSSLGLSADGRFAVWVSPGLTRVSPTQVWRADADNNRVELVSVATDGASEGNGNSKSAAISADGRYVAFASLADNLVSEDTNGAQDVFLRDTQTGETLLLSRTPAGGAARGWSLQPFFSADGRSLFFLSHAPDLAAGDYNQAVDLFKVEIRQGDPNLLAVIRRNVTIGQVELLWNAQPGRRYRIKFKDDLGASVWQDVPDTFTGEAPVPVSVQGNPSRYFRVAEVP